MFFQVSFVILVVYFLGYVNPYVFAVVTWSTSFFSYWTLSYRKYRERELAEKMLKVQFKKKRELISRRYDEMFAPKQDEEKNNSND